MFDLSFNPFSDLAIFLYWFPAIIVLIDFMYATTQEIVEDIERRNSGEFYYPRVKVGDIVAGIILAMLPILNLLAVIFHVIPRVFSGTFKIVCKVLSTPIIPKKK